MLQLADASGTYFDELKVSGIPMDLVETVHYPGAGYCIFMQGTKIFHSVTPVAAAREPRISFVNSYAPRNVFAEDRARFSRVAADPVEVAELEYARHKAWRVQGQMRYIMEDLEFGTQKEEMAAVLEGAAEELLQAKRLLLREESDFVGYLVQDGSGSSEAAVGRDRQVEKPVAGSEAYL